MALSGSSGGAAPAPPPPALKHLGAWLGVAATIIALVLAYLAWAFPNPSWDYALFGLLGVIAIGLLVLTVGAIRGTASGGQTPLILWLLFAGAIVSAVLTGFVGALVLPNLARQSSDFGSFPFSAQLDSAMWQALEEQRYDAAIETAGLLIKNFESQATAIQNQMTQQGVPTPYTGSGSRATDEQRAAIFSRGPLNSVAAAYFVTGRAYQLQGSTAEAREAFEAATRLPYARVYDPQTDTFWSVAEQASLFAGQLSSP